MFLWNLEIEKTRKHLKDFKTGDVIFCMYTTFVAAEFRYEEDAPDVMLTEFERSIPIGEKGEECNRWLILGYNRRDDLWVIEEMTTNTRVTVTTISLNTHFIITE